MTTNASAAPVFQRIVVNVGGPCRTEMLDGREHLVVPMVMMKEGVWAGSGGPKFYRKVELAKACPSWNHKPVVVYHPQKNGQMISACSPDILNTRGCGIVLNTKWEDDKQKSEA
jgi:hypothetical protein